MAEKKPQKDKTKLDISLKTVEDNIAYSDKDQTAYYRLNNIGWDFLSVDAKYAVGQQINNAFVNLMGERQTPIEGHLILTSMPYDLDMWDNQIEQETATWDRAPGYETFMREQHAYLQGQDYNRKVVYLGIKLGSRGSVDFDTSNIMEMGFRGAWDTAKKFASQLGAVHDVVSDDESALAHRRESGFYQILSSGNLRAERATTEEILLLMKREFFPAPLPTPYLEVDHGNRVEFNDIEFEFASSVDNCSRFVRITQMCDGIERTGYRATMSMTRLPHRTYYPESMPFLYCLTRLGFPYTSYARFTLMPNAKMAKEVAKKRKEHADEWNNIKTASAKGGSELDTAPAGFTEAYYDLQEMEQLINDNKTPWIEGHYRIVVEASSERELKERCIELRQAFANIDVTLNLTSGDQVQLFLEQMPGDHLRMKSFRQVTNLEMLGTSGFNFSPEVGDLVKGNH